MHNNLTIRWDALRTKCIISGSCVRCNRIITVGASKEEYDDYFVKGYPIQKALRHHSIASREFLISKLCDKCFNDVTDEDNF